MARRPSGLIKACPTKCIGGYPHSQRSLNEEQLARIPEDILGWVKGYLRYCTYCDAVWEGRGSYKKLHGFLKGEKFTPGSGFLG